MHDVGVALDHQRSFGLDRADLGDAADVVAAEVDEHDVLGALLGVGQQLGLERAVLGVVAPRRRVPASGRIVTVAALDPDEDLGARRSAGSRRS